jgi:hypothetical protein
LVFDIYRCRIGSGTNVAIRSESNGQGLEEFSSDWAPTKLLVLVGDRLVPVRRFQSGLKDRLVLPTEIKGSSLVTLQEKSQLKLYVWCRWSDKKAMRKARGLRFEFCGLQSLC